MSFRCSNCEVISSDGNYPLEPCMFEGKKFPHHIFNPVKEGIPFRLVQLLEELFLRKDEAIASWQKKCHAVLEERDAALKERDAAQSRVAELLASIAQPDINFLLRAKANKWLADDARTGESEIDRVRSLTKLLEEARDEVP